MLRAFSASNGSMNIRPSEFVAFGLAKSCQSYVCGVALRREPPKLEQAQPLSAPRDRYRALLPSCDKRCRRAELGMRHADLLREATSVIAEPASAPCTILQCGIWYGCVAVWSCGRVGVCLVVGWTMRSVKKTQCKTFLTGFFNWIRQSEFS